MTLVGLITLLLFSGLRLGTRAWEGVEAAADRTGALRVARNFLDRTLNQARPVSLTFDGEIISVFSGEAQALEFVAPLSEHVGIPGLYVVRLTLEEGSKRRLILTRWLLHPDVLAGTDEIPAWTPLGRGRGVFQPTGELDEDLAAGAFGSTLLLDDVGDFELRYFGRVDGEQQPEWFEDWVERPDPPLALNLRLTTPEQSWPDSLVRLPEPER